MWRGSRGWRGYSEGRECGEGIARVESVVRVGDGVPWVPEPQNLNERKREKEERRRPTFFPSSFFSFY